MSGYLDRRARAQETRDDRLCPDCGHRVGAHRGFGDDIHCIELEGCPCQHDFSKAAVS